MAGEFRESDQYPQNAFPLNYFEGLDSLRTKMAEGFDTRRGESWYGVNLNDVNQMIKSDDYFKDIIMDPLQTPQGSRNLSFIRERENAGYSVSYSKKRLARDYFNANTYVPSMEAGAGLGLMPMQSVRSIMEAQNIGEELTLNHKEKDNVSKWISHAYGLDVPYTAIDRHGYVSLGYGGEKTSLAGLDMNPKTVPEGIEGGY